MNKKLLLITSVLSLGMLVGCGKKDDVNNNPSTSDNVADVVSQSEETKASSETKASEEVVDNSFATALEAARKLGAGEFSTEEYTITAYVVEVTYRDAKHNSITCWLAAEKNGEKLLQLYGGNLPEGVSPDSIKGGEKIVVSGFLQNFVKNNASTLEISNNKDKTKYPTISKIDGNSGNNGGNNNSSSSQSSQSVTPVGDNKLVFSTTTKSTLTSTEANLASKLGMDASKVTVTSTNSSNASYTNEAAINTKKGDTSIYEIRMYCGKDNTSNCSLTFTMASGLKIETIKFVFEGGEKHCGGKTAATPVVKTGDTVLTGVDGVYTVNASSVKLEATTTESSAQLHVHGIEITYANA